MKKIGPKKQNDLYVKCFRIVSFVCVLLLLLAGCADEPAVPDPSADIERPVLETRMDITLYLPNQEGTGLAAQPVTVGGHVYDAFDAWRVAMEMPEEVKMIGYDFDNHGYETHTTFSGQPVVGYVMGDRRTITVDLSQAFTAQITEQNEGLIMQGLINTLATWHYADKMQETSPVFEYLFFVEGKPLTTSLADYSQPQYPIFPRDLEISSDN